MANDTVTEAPPHRFNYYVKGDLWERLTRHIEAKAAKAETEVTIASELSRALDKYLKAHGR